MKKLIAVLLLVVTPILSAQNKNGTSREQIRALKVSFITEKLNLSKSEAQNFWPIYNDFEKETFQIKHKEMRALRNEIKDHAETMSEAEAENLINRIKTAERKLHALRMELPNKLAPVISSKKIVLLKLVEEEFKRHMFEELKKRKKESH
ncbi:hypothetical protein KFZ70_07045 [Tamlana fucoidanivorans]|uniref:Sensor of ECF-type sigma factor n=1 Tax=Allotamlana fucoidanivorans TaxID=2583814 RepID=A0A5C4SML7_9FLAO|nr:hypothetical protein [Tamlana fucoidanivorans]TNJ45235.1 hypothetical protein FGF67_05870 [Tamlana fucoidanivorans]